MMDKMYVVCKESYGNTYTDVRIYDSYPIYDHDLINHYHVDGTFKDASEIVKSVIDNTSCPIASDIIIVGNEDPIPCICGHMDNVIDIQLVAICNMKLHDTDRLIWNTYQYSAIINTRGKIQIETIEKNTPIEILQELIDKGCIDTYCTVCINEGDNRHIFRVNGTNVEVLELPSYKIIALDLDDNDDTLAFIILSCNSMEVCGKMFKVEHKLFPIDLIGRALELKYIESNCIVKFGDDQYEVVNGEVFILDKRQKPWRE